MNRVLILAPALILAGCTLLIDTDAYRGGRDGSAPPTDGGSTDGAVDAGPPDPNAPTLPEVAIEPAGPVTSDDLTAVIVTESTDPLGGSVTYEYAWFRDDEDAGVATESVEAAVTAKGQMWRVEVTPVSEDGARRGPAGIAEVSIGNTPPTLTTIGLARYEVMVGDRLQALPGPSSDPDGDSLTIRFEWSRNGMPTGDTSSGLLTNTFAAGDDIEVEAWADDGTDESARVRVGPVRMLESTVRWRQVLPDPWDGVREVYDAPHRRFLRYVRGQVWEYVIDGSRLRAVRLTPGGMGPPSDAEADVFLDAPGRRMVVLPADDRARGFALALENRGDERWTSFAVGGPEAPNVRVLPAIFTDDESRRAWVYGGLGGELGRDLPSATLWSFDLGEGTEAWTRHDLTGDTLPGLFAATMTGDPMTASGAVLVGGVALSGGTPTTFDAIHRLSLTEGIVTVETLALTVPGPSFGATGVAIDDERILLAGGADALGPGANPLETVVIDLDAETTEAVPGSALGSTRGRLVPDPDEPDQLVYFAVGDPSAGRPGYVVRRVAAADGRAASVASLPRPSGLVGASAYVSRIGELFILGGTTDSGVNDIIWVFEPSSNELEERTPMPDAISSEAPTARHSVMVDANTDHRFGPVLFGGTTESGPADDRAWSLDTMSNRWIHHTLGSPGTPLTSAVGISSSSGGGCGGILAFGGRRGGAYSNTLHRLRCTSTDAARDCTWEVLASGGDDPVAKAFAGLGTADLAGWVFGGVRSSGSPTAEVHAFDPCAPPGATWTRVVPEGPGPPALHSHSFTSNPATGGSLHSFLVFGGRTDSGYENGVWRLVETSATTARWEVVEAAGTPPDPRASHVAAWDAPRSRLLMYGGEDESGDHRGDLWELVFPE